MRKLPSLIGMRFRKMVVEQQLESSQAGHRRWLCRCDCGATVYKATDSLKNSDESMCATCAGANNSKTARAAGGYVAGTQLSRLRSEKNPASNTSGCRGVYYNPKTNRYRARLKFQGKIMSFGSYEKFEDAVKARKLAEEEIFQKFLASVEE